MKFAQFQSTYKPLPIQTYEQTGRELEEKYYRNREQSSQLRQGLANAKVEDRNIGILAKATSDVEGKLNEVNGKWHYASNILFDAKDRLVNDKTLSASLEDYAKMQSVKTSEQKRFEEGKIGQDALSAFYTYEKLYNTKGITLDDKGQLKNRWVAPTAPNKPDVDAQSIKLVDMLLKNPDAVDSGLRSILTKEGIDSGYLERIRTEGVSDTKIFTVIKGWLANSPEVKDYYSYINKADLLSKTSEVDKDGNVLTKSVLPNLVSEYRNLGWNVDANGNLLDNFQHYINGKGEFDILKDETGKSIEIKDAPKSLLESADVKILMNEGKLNLEDALKQSYLSHKLNNQLNNIADNYKDYAFSKIVSTETMADQGYFLGLKRDQEKKMAAGLSSMNLGKTPMYDANYSIRDAENLRKQLQSAFSMMKSDNPEYLKTKQALDDQTQNITILSKSFGSTTEGKQIIGEQWKRIIAKQPYNKQIELTTKYYDDFTEYMLGTGTFPDIEINREVVSRVGNAFDNVEISLTKEATAYVGYGNMPIGNLRRNPSVIINSNIEQAKVQFQKEVDKKIKTGLSIDNNYSIFRDEKGDISNFHKAQGEYIKTNGDYYVLPYSSTKDGTPVKFQDKIKEIFGKKGYNPSHFDMLWFPSANTSTGFGEGVVKFVPNKDFPNTITPPFFEPFIVRPDASIKNQNLNANMDYILQNTDNPEIIEFAKQGKAMSLYGDTFVPLFNNLAASTKVSNSQELQDQRTINNVRFGNYDYTMFLKPTPSTTGKGIDYNLYLDPLSVKTNGTTYPTDIPVATGKSLPDAIINLYEQHLKTRTDTKDLKSFLNAIGNKESGNNTTIINETGYIGKYQFGQDALDSTGFSNVNKNNFKENPSIWSEKDQDTAMIKLLNKNESSLVDIISKYDNITFKSKRITKSGILAAAHIGGAKGVRKYFETEGRYNPSDSLGTSIEDYLFKFSGYTF